MSHPCHLLAVVGFAAALAGTITPGRSATILQGVADTFLAFEAEANSVVTNGPAGTSNQFVDFADASASGGMALLESNPGNPVFNEGGADGSIAKSFAAYTLNFVNPGDYTLYYTVKTQPETLALDINAGNSFFYSSRFGGAVDTRSASNDIGSLTDYTFFSEPIPFTVSAPGVYAFTLGDREAGTTIDRLVFSSASIPDKAAFGSVPNSIPEPASVTLLTFVLAGAAMGRGGRRKR
jgi:hypothetical protein